MKIDLNGGRRANWLYRALTGSWVKIIHDKCELVDLV